MKSNVKECFEGARVKHWVDHNSLKLYDHLNVLRPETTINDPSGFRVFRQAENDPESPMGWRVLRRGVADLHRRAEVSQAANERYLEALAGVAETQTVKELVEPLCRRVSEPAKPGEAAQGPRPESAVGPGQRFAACHQRSEVDGQRPAECRPGGVAVLQGDRGCGRASPSFRPGNATDSAAARPRLAA